MSTRCIGSLLVLACACPAFLPAQPAAQPVLGSVQGIGNSVSPLPPGGFAIRELQALSAPYPSRLAGMSVAPTRTVILLPSALAAADSPALTLILSNDEGSTDPLAVTWGLRPVFLTADREESGPAVVLDESLAPLPQVAAGQTGILPVMGLGPTDPPVPDGAATPATTPLPAVVHVVRVYFGDVEAEVQATTLAPMTDNRELHRVNLPLPAPPPGVSNATGAIESLFGPGPLALAPWSPLLVAVRFNVSLTVLPGARPFNIALKGPAEGVTVKVDPQAGTWTAAATVPTAATCAGDFSSASLTTWDFTSGAPFVANIVPANQFPPYYFTALEYLPMPNMSSPGQAVALAHSAGVIPASGVLALEFATAGWVPFGTTASERAAGTYSAVFTLSAADTQVARASFDLPVTP